MKKLSIPKKTILLKKYEFNEIFSCGKSLKSRYFKVILLKKNDLKVGFATKRGINSVKRNRLKRITKELWRLNHQDYKINAHLVFLAHVENFHLHYKNLQEDFCSLLGKIEKSVN